MDLLLKVVDRSRCLDGGPWNLVAPAFSVKAALGVDINKSLAEFKGIPGNWTFAKPLRQRERGWVCVGCRRGKLGKKHYYGLPGYRSDRREGFQMGASKNQGP